MDALCIISKCPLRPSETLQRNLSVTANDEVTLRCESRGGNPPADLKWFIGDVEIPNQDGTIFQKNERQTDNPRKWNAVSVLQHGFKKATPKFFELDNLQEF